MLCNFDVYICKTLSSTCSNLISVLVILRDKQSTCKYGFMVLRLLHVSITNNVLGSSDWGERQEKGRWRHYNYDWEIANGED